MTTAETYTCPCGVRHALAEAGTPWRPWGEVPQTPRWWHHCEACGRDNVVQEGVGVVLSLQAGKARPREEASLDVK